MVCSKSCGGGVEGRREIGVRGLVAAGADAEEEEGCTDTGIGIAARNQGFGR